ncbi:hypothetical protein Pmani_013306 [Petrolisthes manimaculis]|uniref:Uncharacterized protein n=1 Tax=Petrolisthes manimaculis TaxID=1843537 RepID=A0AAE1PVT5_9EUCA|nr:hypothetical protein Pmani_013306 [Petrolisthes manimaculis]
MLRSTLPDVAHLHWARAWARRMMGKQHHAVPVEGPDPRHLSKHSPAQLPHQQLVSLYSLTNYATFSIVSHGQLGEWLEHTSQYQTWTYRTNATHTCGGGGPSGGLGLGYGNRQD